MLERVERSRLDDVGSFKGSTDTGVLRGLMFELKGADAGDAGFRRCWEGILVICLSDYVCQAL